MINIKLYKNEIELIRESIQSSKWFGNEPKLCDRLLKKLDKALNIPVVVVQSEQLADEPFIKFERKSKILEAGAYMHPNIKG
jgi:hypothetical protein